ncbi:hypothetical protein GCM10007276_27510 [Agaricicola taiwanensis]|uniref:Right handed beta helix domain-containing protein n=2 Tax=Agaricicola taiwanensis TaxID=591372 RepID=A0A8J2YK49_9RHOB|nr:hypothetical protein GCM10007276_27510 [Agaricicola taiwanensis]
MLALPAEAAATHGGEGGREITVTTLADDGPGSLRAALEAKGPRRIVFKVAGEIWLKSTILVRNPHVTVDGETAPSPGISLMGDRAFRLRTHDVILRHLRVRVGARPTGMDPQNRDAISIDGGKRGKDPAYNILIENCSFAWSIDELVQVWGSGNHDITIRDSILAEALHRSIHPKGDHGMGMIIGPNTRGVLIEGNLFAHNVLRNPVIHGGAHATVANNVIYNPVFNAIHFYPTKRNPRPTVASVIGNVVIAGPQTRPRTGIFSKGMNPGSRVFFGDNISIGTEAFDLAKANELTRNAVITETPPDDLPAFDPIPAKDVEARVLTTAGARPQNRDAIDTRIVEEVRSRTGQIRHRPTDERLWPAPGSDNKRKTKKEK